MPRRFAPLLVLLLLLAGIPRGRADDDADAIAAWKQAVAALRHGELARLEITLAAGPAGNGGASLLPAVRIERHGEIETFLQHVEEAAVRRVLILGDPTPAVATLRVDAVGQSGALRLDVTRRAFRVLDEGSAAYTFQSPALLRWIEDRLEVPQYDLREGKAPALEALRAAFRENSANLTREAQAPATGRSAAREDGMPLVRNGGFEEALVVDGVRKASPAGWDRVDGLTTFWKTDPFARPDGTSGHRALVMDTDVLESEWLERKAEMATDPDSPPWPKTPVESSRQYATVGATYGVSVYSDPIPVVPGQAYRLTLAFRAVRPGGGAAKVWIRGFGKVETSRGESWRRIYDALHTLRTDDATWHEYTQVFHPTKNTPRVERMRVMLYGYWPRGEYRWDDVRIEEISDAAYRTAKDEERADVK